MRWMIPLFVFLCHFPFAIAAVVDSDGDAVNDYREVKDGTDPNDPSSFNNLSKGLRMLYEFSGDVADTSGYFLDGSATGSPTFAVGASGIPTTAILLNGINQRVAFPSSVFGPDVQEFTFFARVHVDALKNGAVIHKGSENGEAQLVVRDGQLTFQVNIAGSGWVSTSTQAHSGYHDVAGTYVRGSKIRLYVDGLLLGEAEVASKNLHSQWGFYSAVGAYVHLTGSFDYFSGPIDEVRVYNRALSSAEVTQLAGDLDSDNDGLNDTEEATLGTNPYLRDTDSDGVNDLREVGDATDPLDPASFDSINVGLVAYYPFNGDANDASGNGFGGSNFGAVATDGRNDASGSAFYFNGTNAYIEYPKFGLSGPRTFSAWVKHEASEMLDVCIILGQMQISGSMPYERWHFHVDPSSAVVYHKQGFQDNAPYYVPTSLRENQWYHYVAVLEPASGDSLKVTLFLDGKEIGKVSTRVPDELNANYQSGRLLAGDGTEVIYRRGNLDDLRVYGRALSAAEVASLYSVEIYSGAGLEGAATKSPFDPATAANWGASGATWSVDTSVTHDGVDSVKAQTTDGQSSYREYTVTGPAVVDFWWKVSSEELYDNFSWSVNGVNQQTISGEVDWTYRTLTLPAGIHTIRWTYTKDGSDAVGQDAGWLDDFVVYPATATLQVRDGSTVLDGEVAVDFGSADQGSAGLTKSLTFLNQGYVPIEAQLSLPQGSPFTFDSGAATFGLLIGRGESVDVPILLSGTSAGNKSGQLTISAPESATAPPSITLTGYVRGPEIGMAEGTTALTSGQTFDMGLAPRTVEFTIRNNGNVGDLVIAGISATGNFQVTQQPATTIPPQTSTTFKVLAQSTATGAQAGSISITSNAGNSAEFSLALTSRSFASIPEGITDGSWTTAGNGGAAVWNLVETTLPSGHAGVAAVTGTTPNNGESVLSMITSGPGVLSWSWRVSTQENFDWLLCEVDGREVAGISSKNGAWQEQAIHVAGGSIVRWVYRKDSTANAGEDRGYIANAAITRFTGTQTSYDFSAPPFAKAGKGLPAIFGWLGHFDAQSGPSAAVYGVGTAADRGRFHYPISKTAKGLVQLEFSKDLVNWSGRNVEQRVLSDDSQRVVIEAAVSNTSNGFFRLYPIAIPDTTSANFNSWRQSARSSLDSVYEINRIISGNLTSSNNLSFLKANVDHLKIVSARAEYIYYPFFQTREEFASIARAITEGEAYWKLHKGF